MPRSRPTPKAVLRGSEKPVLRRLSRKEGGLAGPMG